MRVWTSGRLVNAYLIEREGKLYAVMGWSGAWRARIPYPEGAPLPLGEPLPDCWARYVLWYVGVPDQPKPDLDTMKELGTVAIWYKLRYDELTAEALADQSDRPLGWWREVAQKGEPDAG